MKNIRSALSTKVILVLSIIQVAEAKPKEKFALVIHGGAGTILKKNMTPKKEAAYRAKLEESLKAGYKILSSGGSGGVICIDAKGNIAMPFNTKGMYRGYIKSDGKAVTLIYKND